MNRIKTFLILCFIFSVINVNAQFTTDFKKVNCYSFQLKSQLSAEKALHLSYLISNIDDVLICRVDISGQVNVFCNGQSDIRMFKEKLGTFSDLSFSKLTENTANESLYLKTYALMIYPEVKEYYGNSFEVVNLNDKTKQEMSFGIAKSIWVEQYPEIYRKSIPSDVEKTIEEKTEKADKVSNIDLKSKQK